MQKTCDLCPSEALPKDRTYRILFIGNSYTYYNSMPRALFEEIARDAGYDVIISTVTKGGYSLQKHLTPESATGARVAEQLSQKGEYDFVVLQEQSMRPASADVALFYDSVRELAARIRNIGACPVLYSTWGRETGSADLETHGLTNQSMTYKLAAAYKAIGEELDVPVAYAGLAFYDVYAGQNDIGLYNEDKTHPSYAGSYLAANVLFCRIFGHRVGELSFCGELSKQEAKMLRDAAEKAVFCTPEIPSEYATSSRAVSAK
jgi:hypothetical protein